ncbi:MAG: L-seryl-tRNA(Sec) selenium transferase [Acidobacteria bacterium]|nr:L-seryl-tRNA(Sec) selenium transferase [Acidobacteriota bacterium]
MTKALLRALPSIESLLASPAAERLSVSLSRDRVRDLLRDILDEVRREILAASEVQPSASGVHLNHQSEINDNDAPYETGNSQPPPQPDAGHQTLDTEPQTPDNGHQPPDFFSDIERRLQARAASLLQPSLRRVINATGVILHTNLGRSPLAAAAIAAVAEVAAHYSNLEYDLGAGQRGKREAHCQQLLARLVGSDDAIVVNNCAAAVLLVLNTLAEGGEVIVSRGELIEIGGSFRIPEVMEKSGATLREVGTTNRTRIRDYERAINANTRLILRVHPSNYRVIGFTERPTLHDLVALSQRTGIPTFEDLGSGCLIDLAPFGVTDEPVVSASFQAGIQVAAFSGDKMLGGAQAGIIAGTTTIIESVRKNPLMRALRVDKMTYAALEATLRIYERGAAIHEVPVIRAMALTVEQIAERAVNFQRRLMEVTDGSLHVVVEASHSVIGGGAAPEVKLPTAVLAIAGRDLTAARIEASLRNHSTPIIGRTERDRVLLDFRTVAPPEEAVILEALAALAQPATQGGASVKR